MSGFDAVTLFQDAFIMKRLEKKAIREPAEGARFVSDYWGFPSIPPVHLSETIHVYRMGSGRRRARFSVLALGIEK